LFNSYEKIKTIIKSTLNILDENTARSCDTTLGNNSFTVHSGNSIFSFDNSTSIPFCHNFDFTGNAQDLPRILNEIKNHLGFSFRIEMDRRFFSHFQFREFKLLEEIPPRLFSFSGRQRFDTVIPGKLTCTDCGSFIFEV